MGPTKAGCSLWSNLEIVWERITLEISLFRHLVRNIWGGGLCFALTASWSSQPCNSTKELSAPHLHTSWCLEQRNATVLSHRLFELKDRNGFAFEFEISPWWLIHKQTHSNHWGLETTMDSHLSLPLPRAQSHSIWITSATGPSPTSDAKAFLPEECWKCRRMSPSGPRTWILNSERCYQLPGASHWPSPCAPPAEGNLGKLKAKP